jgi:hypothetical protein
VRPSARGGAARAARGPGLARRVWCLAVPRRGTPRKKMDGFPGLQRAAGTSRSGVGSEKPLEAMGGKCEMRNAGAQRPVIFCPFLGPGAHGKPPYHRPQVDLDALPNRGRAVRWVVVTWVLLSC